MYDNRYESHGMTQELTFGCVVSGLRPSDLIQPCFQDLRHGFWAAD